MSAQGNMDEDQRDTSSASSAPTIVRPADVEAGKRRAKKGRRPVLEWWLGAILSNIWEAVMMFVAYIVMRWFPDVRRIAITLLAALLAVLMKEVLLLYGRLLFRFHTWTALTRKHYAKVSAAQFGSTLPQLAGYFVLSQLPGIPVYVIGLPIYIIIALCLGRPHAGARSAFWQRVGTFTDDVLEAIAYFGDEDDESAQSLSSTSEEKLPASKMGRIQLQFTRFMTSVQARKKEEQRRLRKLRKNQQIEQSLESPSGPAVTIVEEEELLESEEVQARQQPQVQTKSPPPVPPAVNDSLEQGNLVALVFSVVAMLIVAASLIAIGVPVLVFCVAVVVIWIIAYFILLLAMIVYVPVIVALVLVSGSHLGIFVFVGIQIATSLVNVDLGIGPYEWILGICFVVPLYMLICYAFAEKLIRETLRAMRQRVGDDHKLAKLSELYYAIPIDGSQAAIKASDSATGKDGKSATRTPAFFVMSVHDGDPNQFVCRFVEKDQEHLYMEEMLTMRKHEADLTGAAWRGLETNSRNPACSV